MWTVSRVSRLCAAFGVVLAIASCSSDDGSGARPSPSPGPIEGPELRFDGLGGSRFGDAPDDVIAAVTDVLGEPSEDAGWGESFSVFGTCPGSAVRGVRWERLTVLFGDGDTGFASGGERHFFAWEVFRVGADDDPIDMRTAEGIGLGSTVVEVREAYSDAEVVDDEPSGPLVTIAGPEGREIFAYADSAEDRGRVVALQGGQPCGD